MVLVIIIFVDKSIFSIRICVNMGFFIFCGGLFMMLWFMGFILRFWVGGLFIIILIYKICMVFSGLGSLRNVENVMSEIVVIFLIE